MCTTRPTKGTGVRRRIRVAAAVAAGLTLSVGAVTPVAAGTGGPTAPARAAAPAAEGGATVRLITGDRVTVRTDVNGRRTASVTPGEGRRHLLFRTVEEDGHLTVLPSDATGLVTAGRLDRDLFDVTALIAQGYHERGTHPRPRGAHGVGAQQRRRAVRVRGQRRCGAPHLPRRRADPRAVAGRRGPARHPARGRARRRPRGQRAAAADPRVHRLGTRPLVPSHPRRRLGHRRTGAGAGDSCGAAVPRRPEGGRPRRRLA